MFFSNSVGVGPHSVPRERRVWAPTYEVFQSQLQPPHAVQFAVAGATFVGH